MAPSCGRFFFFFFLSFFLFFFKGKAWGRVDNLVFYWFMQITFRLGGWGLLGWIDLFFIFLFFNQCFFLPQRPWGVQKCKGSWLQWTAPFQISALLFQPTHWLVADCRSSLLKTLFCWQSVELELVDLQMLNFFLCVTVRFSKRAGRVYNIQFTAAIPRNSVFPTWKIQGFLIKIMKNQDMDTKYWITESLRNWFSMNSFHFCIYGIICFAYDEFQK